MGNAKYLPNPTAEPVAAAMAPILLKLILSFFAIFYCFRCIFVAKVEKKNKNRNELKKAALIIIFVK
jgi:hypothetical protein